MLYEAGLKTRRRFRHLLNRLNNIELPLEHMPLTTAFGVSFFRNSDGVKNLLRQCDLNIHQSASPIEHVWD